MRMIILAVGLAVVVGTAIADGPPEVTSENVRVIEAWTLKLIEVSHGPPESDAILIDLYVERGEKRRLLAKNLVGPFVPLQRAKKIFSCEANDAMNTVGPVLVDLKGKKTKLPRHPGFLRDCITVGTGEELLLQYSLMDGSALYNLVRVIDASGRTLIEKRLSAEGDVEFTVSGKSHQVRIPAPEVPG